MRMIRLSGCQVGIDIPIEITGIRPGEKLAEVLSTPDEQVLATSHPYINQVAPVPLPQGELSIRLAGLQDAAILRNAEAVRTLLFSAVSASGAKQIELAAANSPAPETSVVPSAPIRPVPVTKNGLPSVIIAPA